MTTIEEIQLEIKRLTPEEYASLRQWFRERDWEYWDAQLEQDSETGKLDFLIEEALAEKARDRLEDI
jgi:hypothetical protein